MYLENPYPPDTTRHQISYFVGEDDWKYFHAVTGNARGLAAKLAANFFHELVQQFHADNLTVYDPEYNSRIADAIQRVQLRTVDGIRHFNDERGTTESTTERAAVSPSESSSA